jgi:hypothetical protein
LPADPALAVKTSLLAAPSSDISARWPSRRYFSPASHRLGHPVLIVTDA